MRLIFRWRLKVGRDANEACARDPGTPRRRDTGATVEGRQRHTGPSHKESPMESLLNTPQGWSLFSILLRARPPVRRKVPREAATHLGGSASPLLLVVHHQIAVGVGPVVTPPLRLLAGLRIDRRAKSRGLHAPERVGFVRVTRERGRPARVALVREPAGGLAWLVTASSASIGVGPLTVSVVTDT
jgi:hypothetical protein